MRDARTRVRDVVRTQLDRRLGEIRSLMGLLVAPDQGWIATLRSGLAMTQGELARRVGVSQQAISQLERREIDGSATLNALRDAASALDAVVVYAIVPRRSLQETLEDRAWRLAGRMTGSVRHSMRLEDQDPEVDTDARTRALAEELLEDPAQLWSTSLDP